MSVTYFVLWTRGDRLLDEHGDTWEVLKDLDFNVPARLSRAPKHRGTPDDERAGAFGRLHIRNEVTKRLVDAGVLVSRLHERLTFGL